eukprot:2315769-Alexandrium_andersonii.AAC.1
MAWRGSSTMATLVRRGTLTARAGAVRGREGAASPGGSAARAASPPGAVGARRPAAESGPQSGTLVAGESGMEAGARGPVGPIAIEGARTLLVGVQNRASGEISITSCLTF